MQDIVNWSELLLLNERKVHTTIAILAETGTDTNVQRLHAHVSYLLSYVFEHASSQSGLVGARVHFRREFTPAPLYSISITQMFTQYSYANGQRKTDCDTFLFLEHDNNCNNCLREKIEQPSSATYVTFVQ